MELSPGTDINCNILEALVNSKLNLSFVKILLYLQENLHGFVIHIILTEKFGLCNKVCNYFALFNEFHQN